MRILRPFRRSAGVRHVSALSAPSVIAAASSKLMPAGVGAIRALSRMHMTSAWSPNRSPLLPKTRSPTANSLAAAPTASTSPANSLPRMRCLGLWRPETMRLRSDTARPLRRFASRVWTSKRLTVLAWTLMRTSSSLGTGRSTSSRRWTSGGPYPSYTPDFLGGHTLLATDRRGLHACASAGTHDGYSAGREQVEPEEDGHHRKARWKGRRHIAQGEAGPGRH